MDGVKKAKAQLTEDQFKELTRLMKLASHAQQMSVLRYSMKSSAVKSFIQERSAAGLTLTELRAMEPPKTDEVPF